MTIGIGRREFVGGLAAAALWPVGAWGQQNLPVIGVLSGGSRNAYDFALSPFAKGLLQQGYVEDRNVSIQYSWADGHYDLLPSMAAEFVRRRVALIVTLAGTATAKAAQAATSTIPIVFTLGSDPRTFGLVTALNRPGGNLTGATSLVVELGPKRVELVHDLLPGLDRIALLTNPANPNEEGLTKQSEAAAAMLGIESRTVAASSDSDLDPAFERLVQSRIGALIVSNDPFHLSRRERIAALAARHRIPAIYGHREFVTAGGLVSYGANSADIYVIAGDYVGRILKGAKPSDLPVVQPASFELVINLRAAKALGLDFPPTIAARATEVIE